MATGRAAAAADSRTEALLHRMWSRLGEADGPTVFRARSGEPVRVLYAGRSADGAGPDFRDAVLQSSDGGLIRGDVEIHVRASGWYEHGHQHDPRYNGVVAHVASHGDRDAISSAGVVIPLLILGDPAVAGSRQPAGRIGDLIPRLSLAEAGDRRFLARSSGFQLALRARSADDVMWAAVLEGLGYARNRKGFRRLAARLPWDALKTACGNRVASLPVADIEALLLWAAGLGSRPTPGSPAGAAADRLGALPGEGPVWVRAAGRPANSLACRTKAAATLAQRWLTSGGPAASMERLALSSSRARELADALVVRGECAVGSCLGAGRAGTIVVNAILPCLHAIAFDAGRWHVAERCLALYRAHPKLPGNGIEREVRRLLTVVGRPATAANARDQQGMIYLYRAMTAR